MFRYLKASPTSYVLQFKNGAVKREGPGLSFFYWEPSTTLVMVPLATTDVPFVFNEVTADFQALTVQGQLTWRVVDPKRLAGLLDFSVNGAGKPLSDDLEKLMERLVNTTQVLTRAVTGGWTLKEALVRSDVLVGQVLAALKNSEVVKTLGLEVLALSIVSLKPSAEMARALEAEAREALQGKSDEAIYARRNAAVSQERTIKESELATEVMVEEKKRHIRETQMRAEIAIEEQRATLIDQRVANEKKSADSQAYTLEKTLEPIRTLDWKMLQALQSKGADPRAMIALAFQELAGNATKIGELNMSPDLLRSLLGPGEVKGAGK